MDGIEKISITDIDFSELENVKKIKIPASVNYISKKNAFIGNFTGVTVEIDENNAVYKASGNKISEKETDDIVWLGSRYGNVNGDLTVSLLDISALREYLANYDADTETSTVTIASGADANGDGAVTLEDLILLRRYFADYDYEKGQSAVELGRAVDK